MSPIHTVDRLEDVPQPAPDAQFVIVDVIISSTSIVRLLEAGARYVRPFGDPDDALAFKRETDDAVLVGEDGGGPIEGFDLSPLPSILETADLEDRPVGIRTSNGTRAIERIGYRDDILIGSTINAAAVAETLASGERDAWVIAAGRQGSPTPEDTAGAAMIERCYRDEGDGGDEDDASEDDDGDAGDDANADLESLREDVETCDTAAWLRELGFENEVEELLAFNSSETVPRMRDGVFVAE